MRSFAYIGHFVRAFRGAKSMSLEALAAASGVSRSMIASIESAQKVPSIAVLAKLADAMAVDLSDLVAPPRDVAEVSVFTSDEGNRVSLPGAVMTLHRSVGRQGSLNTTFLRFTFASHGKSDFFKEVQSALTHLYVEHGSVKAYLSCDAVQVTSGQMLRFAAFNPHRFECSEGPLASGVLMTSSLQA